ncbi:glutathione S-transferase family protein [Xenophilus sp. Marseille-Q4582]|uniref:glutathione S-transferase family protein n=1 Tax=Xenophilus sp. Marseille-Q4582 TaxID=2866600 RepID=UPI001CE42701|nr:glutathione S-transferase family protein [Xenophilus sp. Marseille-Q4582]
MPELILHHYAMSPFAEKARLMLGGKKLAWQSVIVPPVMPKPDLVALTGGYRRVPVLQVGADVYCDTALIADVLEHLQPEPTFFPEPEKGLARTLAQWADTTLFAAAMAYSFQPQGVAEIFAGAPPETAQAFLADRAGMYGNQPPRMHPSDAAGALRSYLRRLSDMLDDRTFLLGSQPCIADFSVYHCLWFVRRLRALHGVLNVAPAVLDWMDRMQGIGHGSFRKITAADALAAARAAQPHTLLSDSTFQDDHGIALGSPVRVRAESFGLEETHGRLVAATRTHYTVARDSEATGLVHVHFPRLGYALRKAEG